MIERRRFLAGVGALCVAASISSPAMPAVLRGRGKFRSLALNNARTGEWIDTVYWIDGDYVPDALDAFNRILRDWRQEEIKPIDAGVIDILSATHQLLDTEEPFEIISGYRTPETNAMLRARSKNSGVASNSYHIKAMAVDITLKSRSVRQISGAGLSLKAGGVGKYSHSHFVHLDCGPVRRWGA